MTWGTFMAAEEIGSIGKATAGDILTSRKIYLVTMVQPSPGAPEGFEQRYNDYWSAVEQQISKLEATAGAVNHIFAEGVIGRGDDAMLMVQQSNPGAHSLIRQRVSAGAVFEEFEDTELQNEMQSSVANIIQNVIDDKLAIIKKMKSKCTKYVNKKLQPNMPKKPVNTYILFSTHGPYKAKAAELVRKEQKIPKKETVPHKLVMKKLGEMWTQIKTNAEDESHEDHKIFIDTQQANVVFLNEKFRS